jgi:hypothetical protein
MPPYKEWDKPRISWCRIFMDFLHPQYIKVQLLKQAMGRMTQVSSTFFRASMEVSPSVLQLELTTSSPSKQARRDHLTRGSL